MRFTPEFRARPPWWGGDLQTLRNQILGRSITFDSTSQRLYFPLSDGSGDQMTAMLETPADHSGDPVVVLIHGLTGCEDSFYIRASTKFHLRRGRQLLRLNLRGAGPSRKTCGEHYHAGCADDLRDALSGLSHHISGRPLFLIGFSLGGNALINLLAKYHGEFPILGAATVSAPIEPAEAARRIRAPRNRIYHGWLLRRMKQECTASGARLSDAEREAILSASNIYEFDDRFIAPRNGFTGADDYYRRTAGASLLRDIEVPLLMIHADDDPWIPAAPYRKLQEDCPANVTLQLTRGGGHAGFHARDDVESWHDRCIGHFIQNLPVTPAFDKRSLRQ